MNYVYTLGVLLALGCAAAHGSQTTETRNGVTRTTTSERITFSRENTLVTMNHTNGQYTAIMLVRAQQVMPLDNAPYRFNTLSNIFYGELFPPSGQS